MAISAKMLRVLQRVDAAMEAHLADLRARGAVEKSRAAKAKQALAATRRAARAVPVELKTVSKKKSRRKPTRA